MVGNQLDEYNTTFNHLLRKCSWNHDEQGTMQLYRRGLMASLLRRMLDQDDHPDTLDGWQDLAIKYQGRGMAKIQASRKRTSCNCSTESETTNKSVQRIAWMWMSQKPPKTTRREGFVTFANSQGISRRIARKGWLRRPKEGSHQHRHIKLRWLMKKKKTPSLQ
jgi:hypothetical protein